MTGDHLKNLITKEGYTINKMAELIGVAQPNLLMLLKHEDVRTGLVEKVAKAIGKPLSFFYGEAYGPVAQVTGTNNATATAGDNSTATATASDDRLITLLLNKDEQLTMSMRHTEKAIDQTAEVLRQSHKSQEQIDELIKLINR